MLLTQSLLITFIQIPNSVSKGKFRLEIEGSGGLTFNETKDVRLEPKVTSVYIQTDKAVYKPGQTGKNN